MTKILTSWIGFTDIRASRGEEKDGYGPICQAIQVREFDEINLISDLSPEDTKNYISWLKSFTQTPVILHIESLTNPTNFGEIYEAVTRVIKMFKHERGKMLLYLFT
jgi:hypothetical protein